MANMLDEEQPNNNNNIPNADVVAEEERLLNLALQQDLLQQQNSQNDNSLQQAILANYNANSNIVDDEMRAAMQMSMDEHDKDLTHDEMEPDLQKALALSMAPNNNNNNNNQNQQIAINNDEKENKVNNESENKQMDEKQNEQLEMKVNNNNLIDLNITDLYNLLPVKPYEIREEMKTETFINRLKQSEQIKNEIITCENRLIQLKNTLKGFEDMNIKKNSLDAWNIFLKKWSLWDINGLYYYLIRIENGKYKHYINNKQIFLDNWNKLVLDDNGERFNNNNRFYGHYLSQFESDDLSDLGISSRQDRRHIMSNFRSLIAEQLEGMSQ